MKYEIIEYKVGVKKAQVIVHAQTKTKANQQSQGDEVCFVLYLIYYEDVKGEGLW